MEVKNANPTILNLSDLPTRKSTSSFTARRRSPIETVVPTYPLDPFSADEFSNDETEDNDEELEPIDAQEIYDLVAPMTDPEHPISLGELGVINLPDIHISSSSSSYSTIRLEFTPTITHCHLATVIGLGLVVRLRSSLPPRYRVDVGVKEGSHATGDQLNKQLADKERVVSALENETLRGLVGRMMESCK